MAWYAIDSIKPAYDKTINLLFKPFNFTFWLKLALIVLLIELGGGCGGFGALRNIGGDSSSDNSDHFFGVSMYNIGLAPSIPVGDDLDTPVSIMNSIRPIVLVVAILIVLILSYISAVMSFVFLDSVIRSQAEIVGGFKKYAGAGFRLFLFELVLEIVLLLVIAILTAIYCFIFRCTSNPVLLIIGIIALVLLLIAFEIISSFTRDFVIVYMYNGSGLIAGWKNLISVLRINLGQILLYVLMKIGIGILAVIATIVVLLILGIPAILILFLLGFLLGMIINALGISGPDLMHLALLAIIILLAIAAGLLFSYLVTLVTLPISVFFRYYSLIFLTNIDKGFKILEVKK